MSSHPCRSRFTARPSHNCILTTPNHNPAVIRRTSRSCFTEFDHELTFLTRWSTIRLAKFEYEGRTDNQGSAGRHALRAIMRHHSRLHGRQRTYIPPLAPLPMLSFKTPSPILASPASPRNINRLRTLVHDRMNPGFGIKWMHGSGSNMPTRGWQRVHFGVLASPGTRGTASTP